MLSQQNFLGPPQESANSLKELNNNFFNQHLQTSHLALKSVTSVIIHKDAILAWYKYDKNQRPNNHFQPYSAALFLLWDGNPPLGITKIGN